MFIRQGSKFIENGQILDLSISSGRSMFSLLQAILVPQGQSSPQLLSQFFFVSLGFRSCVFSTLLRGTFTGAIINLLVSWETEI